MRTEPFAIRPVHNGYGMRRIIATLVLIAPVTLAACESAPQEEHVRLWPLFNARKTVHTDDAGNRVATDTGSFLLLSWNKSSKTNPAGEVVERRENGRVYPLLSTHEEENAERKHSSAKFLLLSGDKTEIKEAAAPNVSDSASENGS